MEGWRYSFTPRALYPRGKSRRCSSDRRLGGLQSRSGRDAKIKSICPCRELYPGHPTFIVATKLTELSRPTKLPSSLTLFEGMIDWHKKTPDVLRRVALRVFLGLIHFILSWSFWRVVFHYVQSAPNISMTADVYMTIWLWRWYHIEYLRHISDTGSKATPSVALS
jgi:hypothetical protein